MRDRLLMAEAARMLVATGKLSDRSARQVLIAALIEEQLVAVCDAYWRESIPAVSGVQRSKKGHVQADTRVPSDFWRPEHSSNFEWKPDTKAIPTGSWGSWEESRFTTEIEVTGYAASNCYPDFVELGQYGSSSVSLAWTAIGVTLHKIDLESLIERGRFNALIRRAERKIGVRWGNLTRSDALRIIARYCATLMSFEEKEKCESHPGRLLEVLQQVAIGASEEAAVSDRVLRSFAAMVAKEASELTEHEREIPPSC